MDGNALMALIVTGFIALVILAIAVVLLSGRGAGMIAGYNTSSAAEKAKYDEKKLCRFVGGILLPIALGMPAVAIGAIYGVRWLAWAYGIFVVALCVFAVIYLNTGNRYKKK